MKEITFDINESVQPGTAELDPIVMILSFHSLLELLAWKQGKPFKLINHWIKEAPPPRYK